MKMGGMVGRRGIGVERRKIICVKGWSVKSRDNPVVPWYTGSRTWRKVENDRIGNKELFVARGNERYRTICGRMWYVLKNEE